MRLTLKEVAQCLHLPLSTVERWIRQGRIPIQRGENGLIFNDSALEKWAATHNLPFTRPIKDKALQKDKVSQEVSQLENLLSVMQRGGVFHNVNGDDVPRHLVMLVDDFLVSDAAPSPRQWLRQSMDLMTLLVMLRATLLTRMTGDSGLRQPIALVPVGGTGLTELVIAHEQLFGGAHISDDPL